MCRVSLNLGLITAQTGGRSSSKAELSRFCSGVNPVLPSGVSEEQGPISRVSCQLERARLGFFVGGVLFFSLGVSKRLAELLLLPSGPCFEAEVDFFWWCFVMIFFFPLVS